jgi:putative inorganic carbon (HCO3(-)) transporter
VAGGAIWLVMIVLWVTGATDGGFAIFLGTLLCAALGTGCLAAAVARGKEPFVAARAVGVIVLSAAVPVVFDPHSGDVFNLPKYTVAVIGALVLAGLWFVAGVHHREAPRWRNGLQWVVAALIAWTAISALAGVDVRVSLLGNYGSYDGLYSAAAFGVILMTAAEAFDATDVRKVLGALAFCGGTVVVVYGLIQLPDTEAHGVNWDFIKWHLGSFNSQIFSTFGNPNHLGGFLDMVLPAVLVLGLGAKYWPGRVAAAVLALAVLTELARTAARGAWLGAIAALLALAVLLAPELRRRAALALGGAGVVLGAAVVGLIGFGHRFLSVPLSSLFQTGGTSTVEQRAEIWTAAVHIAVRHPITGTGPDTFALMYPRYQSSTWVKDFGPNFLVNGAHDIFMNILADQGFIGLALFLALLAFLGLRTAGAWRRLRVTERDESLGPAARERARSTRACLAVVAASIIAYVVQAAFNVQQVGLTFVFWLLVGLLAALALSARVPDTLHPAKLLAAGVVSGHDEVPAPKVQRLSPAPAYRGASRRRRSADYGQHWPTAVAALAAVVVVVLLAIGGDEPYRADHDYWAANKSIAPNANSSAPTAIGPAYFADIHSAISLNPWEPTYPVYEATIYNNVSQHDATASRAITDLTKSRDLLQQAISDEDLWGPYPASEAQADLELAQLQPADKRVDLVAAAKLAREAIKDDPRDSSYHTLLSQILAGGATAKAAAKP